MTWNPIQPLDPAVEERLRGDLTAVDALHRRWREFTAALDEADKATLRRRTLRKQAIETGILERLYDLDWGITRALVAEGLTKDVVFRSGGEVSDGVLATIQTQLAGLELVIDYVRDERSLSSSFIKELHSLMTRTQDTYDATNSLGHAVKVPLNHGSFKEWPNNVELADGSLVEFAPPEQVTGEIERLVQLYGEMINKVHPIVSASWLHHRFVQIHPFQDGNGRVARALTHLSLERAYYPPIVVGRLDRDRYLNTLDTANRGDLARLGQLFAKLAMRSIRGELEEPIPAPTPQTAKEVARAFARSLDQKGKIETERRKRGVHIRSQETYARIQGWQKETCDDLESVFEEQGLSINTDTRMAEPDSDQAGWWYREIIETAKRLDYFADWSSDKWWQMLQVNVNGFRLQFVVSIHHVGSPRTGVMAITSFGLIQHRAEGVAYSSEKDYIETSLDAFTFSYDEEVENRAQELYDWLEQSWTVALQELRNRVLGRANGVSGDG